MSKIYTDLNIFDELKFSIGNQKEDLERLRVANQISHLKIEQLTEYFSSLTTE
jgi:hypothetical protein